MTTGSYRVGISFNPSGDTNVDLIKASAAALIDLIESIQPPVDGTHFIEVARLKSLAATAIEEGAMWAVKAATKPPMVD
jgi:hypothetical protein